jgi:hypothetical protein
MINVIPFKVFNPIRLDVTQLLSGFDQVGNYTATYGCSRLADG